MHRLPPMPTGLAALAPLRVGAAARLDFGGAGLHQMPEVWVDAAAPAVLRACPQAVAVPGWPGHLQVGAYLVRPLAGASPEAELRARILPVDAFGVRPDGTVLDPLGGVEALRARRLDLPQLADLEADPVLLVQLFAVASELGWAVAPEVADALAPHAGWVLRADRDRLREAMTRLLVSLQPEAALTQLHRSGVLTLVLPEVVALVDFHRSSRFHHKDVWLHTLQVVSQAVPRPTVRWAALLHDVGKVHTRSFTPDRKVHFLLHDELGELMCEGIAARLRFPPPLAQRVLRLVRLHLRANLYDVGWSDAAIRRFAAEVGEDLDELLLLSRADVTSKRPGRRRQAMYHLHALQTRIRGVALADAARKPMVPKGLGQAIIEGLGIRPGPEVGRLRALCEEATRAGRLPPAPTADECLAFLRSSRDVGAIIGDSTPRARASAT